jgi:lysophospholipase L1-like esterase
MTAHSSGVSGLSRRRTLVFSVLSLALFLTVLFLAGEAATRYRERHRSTVPGSFPFLVYQHRTLMWALEHDADYFGWIHTDSSGFRRGLATQHRPDAIRIVADGASTTFDFGVTRDERTWPARLEHFLHELRPDLDVEVVNAGVPGYLLSQNVGRLQTGLYAFQPDLLILLTGHNDLSRALVGAAPDPLKYDKRPNEVLCVSAARRWLSRHSLLFAKVQDRLASIARQRRVDPAIPGGAPSADNLLEQRLARGTAGFERDVRFYVSAANSLGIPVVLPAVVHVSDPGAKEPRGPEARSWQGAFVPSVPILLEGYRRYNETLRLVAGQLGASFLDTAPFGIHGTQYYAEGDPIHFNDAGADLMARKLAEQLVSRGLLEMAAAHHSRRLEKR